MAFKFKFYYDPSRNECKRQNEINRRLSPRIPQLTPTTTDVKILREDGAIVARGSAYLNPIDRMCYEIGRRVAIEKAISSLDKETRTAIWNDYFDSKEPEV